MEAPAFLEDIYPENFLYALTIRSPIAKGRLKSINFPELPENYTVITAKNIPGENRLENTSMPVLAEANLSYIGEPVAIILGHDKTKLEELASKCEITADEEKAVFSNSEAANLKQNTPSLLREVLIGSTETFYNNSGKIVADSYVTGIQEHWYAEPAGAVTWYEKNKLLTVKTATQWPFHVKRSVACLLGIETSLVSVEPTSLNLHMDGKLWFPSLLTCHAALGTFITKKPVRLILTREEDFLFSPKRCNSNIDIASIINENGDIMATEIDISVNIGAHEVFGQEILDQVCLGCIGYYNFCNVKVSARVNLTNIPPQGAFCGFGISQGAFVIERHISQIADMVNQDPALWRKNKINTNLILPSAHVKSIISGDDLINQAAKMSDYHRKWASYELLRQTNKEKKPEKGENPRGIGIAIGFQGNDLLYHHGDKGKYSIEVTLTKEGVLEIKTNIS
ncbi:MAG: xanthine dehydrogenase family protein molybdopterin-binding subunit, partial [Treponema sp.]|nr:xanthine dehydrogenase family protein molybdopterin-binding subunit [Treponema sp.]